MCSLFALYGFCLSLYVHVAFAHECMHGVNTLNGTIVAAVHVATVCLIWHLHFASLL